MTYKTTSQHFISLDCRSNRRSVFLTAMVFAVAQSMIFFLYAAGYVFGAYLVVEGRNNYGEIFR